MSAMVIMRLSRAIFAGIVIAAALAAGSLASAQNSATTSQSPPPTTTSGSEDSLAAAARDTKAQKSLKAKKVFTDEDMEATAGPLPRLKMDGPENGDEIIAAITKYKATHNPEETERAVRIWFDRYDEMLAGAIQENQNMQSLHNANMSNGYDLCQESGDYQQCQKRQMAEQRGIRSDSNQMMKNNQLEVRIQHVFMKVRNGLSAMNLRYDWFKIRTTNGIDSF